MPTHSSTDRRVVVLTGANEGIGYGMLTRLVENGYRVAGLDVNGENIESLRESNPDSVRYYDCDVTEPAAVERAVSEVVAEWDRIDILVNNAAVLDFGFFEDQTAQDLDRVFAVNFFGAVRLIRLVLPHMRTQDGGIIHNVSSGAGRVGHPGVTGYAATKGALESFTRSLRLELRHSNVTCTIMHPRLAATRSAQTLGYPESQLRDPAYVGGKLAERIESTRPVIYTDWVTRIGLFIAERFPSLVAHSTDRFLTDRKP